VLTSNLPALQSLKSLFIVSYNFDGLFLVAGSPKKGFNSFASFSSPSNSPTVSRFVYEVF
jgi:hypothetical protein